MMKQLLAFLILGGLVMAPMPLCAQRKKKRRKDTLVAVHTVYGDMMLRLYNETPVHKANFLKLVGEGFYDSTTFHRVIEGFMIQGGDPYSKDSAQRSRVGQGGPGYTLPAELVPGLIHRRGALAAARQGDAVNPERRSSGSQFYIVQGKTFTEEELDQAAQRIRQVLGPDYAISDSARQIYTTVGGSPWLDEQYTIFGEVVEGLAVIDQIAAQPVNRRNHRPQEDIIVQMELEPIRVRKLRRRYGER